MKYCKLIIALALSRGAAADGGEAGLDAAQGPPAAARGGAENQPFYHVLARLGGPDRCPRVS